MTKFLEYTEDQLVEQPTIRLFSELGWDYKNCFDLKSADQTTEEMVIRLTVSNVLRSRKVIAEIKGKVKL